MFCCSQLENLIKIFSVINNVDVLVITPCCKIETFTAVTLTVFVIQFILTNKKIYLGSQKSCIKSKLIKEFGLFFLQMKDGSTSEG